MFIASSALSLLLAAAYTPTHSAEPPPRDPDALILAAEIALERGDCKLASESYAAATPLGDVALAQRASEVALACEHLPAAWNSVQRWRELAPNDISAAAVYSTVAIKLYRIPEARDGIATLLRATAGQDNADAKLAELTSVLLDEAETPGVLAAVSGAVDTAKASPTVLALLAELAFDSYDLHRAEQYAQLALKQNSTLFDARRILAHVYAARGDSANAIAAARAAAESDAKRGVFELANAYATLDRMDDARAELERLRSAGTPDVEVDRQLAMLAFQNGDMKEATRRFTALATSAEGDDGALFYLAEIAERADNADDALAGYRKLLNSSVAITARLRAAGLLLSRGNRDEALTLLADYASDHPERGFEISIMKAQLLADHGEVDSGIALLSAALVRHPQHPALEYSRATLLERAGQVKKAVVAMELLLDERTDDPTLLNAIGYTLAEHNMRLAHAEILIRRALVITPDNPAVIDSLGWVRFKRGDARGAVKLLDRAYSMARDSEIAAHLGEALWKSGSRKRAKEVWDAALKRDGDSESLRAAIARYIPLAKP